MVTALLALLGCSGKEPAEFACPQLAWVHQFGGPFAETVAGVDVAANGHILVGGGFGATVTFGADVHGVPVTRSACGNNYLSDAFVASYRPDGRVNWVATLSSCQFSRTYALAATPLGGAVAIGLFDYTLEVEGIAYSNPDENPSEPQLWIASWSSTGMLQWFVTGYADDIYPSSIAVDATGAVYVAGKIGSTSTPAVQFSNGLEGDMPFPSDGYPIAPDGFLAALEPDGSGRWLRLFGTAGSDTPAQVAVAGDVVGLAHWPAGGTMVFDRSRADATIEATNSVISTWRAEAGEWMGATGIGVPTSTHTVGLAGTGSRFLSGSWASASDTYGEGNAELTFASPIAHGLVTEWSVDPLTWQAHALLDDDPTPGTGSVVPDRVDARADGWAVLSGMLYAPATLTTTPPRTIDAGELDHGDGYVGLVDTTLAQRCAWWMPGPGIEEVRAALSESGGVAVVGAFDEITIDGGTPGEVSLTGERDGFIAWFAPAEAE